MHRLLLLLRVHVVMWPCDLRRPNNIKTQWTPVLVSKKPNVDTTLMKMMTAMQLSDILARRVSAEADAALHVTIYHLTPRREATFKLKSLRILLKDVRRDSTLEIGLHQVVEKQDTKYPVKHNTDEVQQTMPPKLLGKDRLSFQSRDTNDHCDDCKPAIIKEQQPSFHTKWMGVDVKEPLGN